MFWWWRVGRNLFGIVTDVLSSCVSRQFSGSTLELGLLLSRGLTREQVVRVSAFSSSVCEPYGYCIGIVLVLLVAGHKEAWDHINGRENC